MDAQVDGPSTVALTQTKALVPGYLLTPFGWAAKPLAAMIQTDPALLRHIFELDRPRMHVIALALAHLDDNPAPHLAPILFRGSARRSSATCRRPGSRRIQRGAAPSAARRAEPTRVSAAESNSSTTPCARKCCITSNRGRSPIHFVSILYEAPAVLRPVLAELLRVIESTAKLDHLPDGLRWLVWRGAAASFDALIVDLAAQAQPGQFVAPFRGV